MMFSMERPVNGPTDMYNVMDGPEIESEIEDNLASTVSGHDGSFTRGPSERSRYKATNKNEVAYYQV